MPLALKTVTNAVPLVRASVTEVALAAPFDVAKLTAAKPVVVVLAAMLTTLAAALVFLRYSLIERPAVKLLMLIVLVVADAL